MYKVKTDVSSGNPKSQGIISVIMATRLRFKGWFDPIFHYPIQLFAQSKKNICLPLANWLSGQVPLERSIIGCETEKLIKQVFVSLAELFPMFVILRYYFLLLQFINESSPGYIQLFQNQEVTTTRHRNSAQKLGHGGGMGAVKTRGGHLQGLPSPLCAPSSQS